MISFRNTWKHQRGGEKVSVKKCEFALWLFNSNLRKGTNLERKILKCNSNPVNSDHAGACIDPIKNQIFFSLIWCIQKLTWMHECPENSTVR